MLGTFFDQVTPGNAGKWGCVEAEHGQRVWTNFDAMADFARRNCLAVKYHTIVWGMQQPAWLKSMKAEEVRTTVDAWIEEVFRRNGKQCAMIDVLNEPISQPAGYREALGGKGKTGWDWVVWVFERARHHAKRHEVSAELILNEWGPLGNSDKRKAYQEIVEIGLVQMRVTLFALVCPLSPLRGSALNCLSTVP